jgi:beta-glucanase (GH16 family)
LGGAAAYHFHSPGCQSGVVTYYYDGNEVGQITTGITSSPMYLILNYAVAGQGGAVVTPSTMQVDYVRVWQ